MFVHAHLKQLLSALITYSLVINFNTTSEHFKVVSLFSISKCVDLTDVCLYPMHLNCCPGEFFFLFKVSKLLTSTAHGIFTFSLIQAFKMVKNKYPLIYCPPFWSNSVYKMNTNAFYGHFVFIWNKAQRKTCFACGREAVCIQTCHIDLRFGEIRYESSARVADRVKIQEFCDNLCEKGFNSLWM